MADQPAAPVGRAHEIELLGAALASGAHVVLEGPPGTGKSTLLRAVAAAQDVAFLFVEGNAELTPARLVGHFEGRNYSEMWEVFANNAALALDANPVTPGVQPLAYPGISNIEQYLETRLTAAVRGAIGPHVRFAATFALQWESDHAITFADAGVDGNGNNVIDAGTAEVNPLHNDKIDLVGHRYISEDNFGYTVGLEGEVLF